MKSRIANWRTMSAKQKSISTAQNNAPISSQPELEYRNMVDDYTKIYNFDNDAVNYPFLTNFPATNLGLETATKEMRSTATVDGFFTGGFIIEPNKTDTEGYDFLAIKFNKLNKELMEFLSLGIIDILFRDSISGLPAPSVVLQGVDIRFNKSLSSISVSGAQPAPSYSTPYWDDEEGVLYISKSILDQLELLDRDGNPTDKILHKYVIINVLSADTTSLDYVSISNITITNSMDLELENGIKPKYKSLDRIKESNQGIEFTDRYNTKKEVDFNIPLLTQEEFRSFDRNFFRYSQKYPFFIFPLDIENEVYEDLQFAGFLKMDSDYSPDRREYNLYEVKFKCNEVI